MDHLVGILHTALAVMYLLVPAVTVFQSLCQDKKNSSQELKRVLKLQGTLPGACQIKMWVYVRLRSVACEQFGICCSRSVCSADKKKKCFL